MSAHPHFGYGVAPERAPRKSYRHQHHRSSDSGVGSSSDQDSYTTNPDWNYAVLDSAAAAHADDRLATIASLNEALREAKARVRSLERKFEQSEAEAKARVRTLERKVEQSDAEAAAKERELLKRDQEYRDLYGRYEAIIAREEVLTDDVKRLTEEKAALAQKYKELEADMQDMKETNTELERQRRKLEKKLASAAAVASSSSEEKEAQSEQKESRKKEGNPPSVREGREGRSRSSATMSGANPSAPRRSESKRRSTKTKDALTDKFERAQARAAAQAQAQAQAQEGEGEIYEEPWGPSAPRRRRDSTAAATASRRMAALAITPRADSSAFSDVSHSSRTDSNGYTRPSDIYIEDATYRYRAR